MYGALSLLDRQLTRKVIAMFGGFFSLCFLQFILTSIYNTVGKDIHDGGAYIILMHNGHFVVLEII